MLLSVEMRERRLPWTEVGTRRNESVSQSFPQSSLSWKNMRSWASHWLPPPRGPHSCLAPLVDSMIYPGKPISFLLIWSQTLVMPRNYVLTLIILAILWSWLVCFWKVFKMPGSTVLWCPRRSPFLFIAGNLACTGHHLPVWDKVAIVFITRVKNNFSQFPQCVLPLGLSRRTFLSASLYSLLYQ